MSLWSQLCFPVVRVDVTRQPKIEQVDDISVLVSRRHVHWFDVPVNEAGMM